MLRRRTKQKILTMEMEEHRSSIRLVAGDFNARLYEVQPDEAPNIGNNIIERKGYLTKGMSDDTRDNRNRFVDFTKIQNMAVMNTLIEKTTHKRVTYKEKVPEHNPEKPEYQGENTAPFNHSKYAQCDYWLIDETHKCMFLDCESKIKWGYDTDHYPVWGRLQLNKKVGKRKASPEGYTEVPKANGGTVARVQ